MRSNLCELKTTYDIELARKENRLEEYNEQMEQEWEDYNFDLGQRMS